MRENGVGLAAITSAISALESRHDVHIAHYGAGLDERLTGLHETCSIDEFRGGVADRGASIRIPRSVQERGYGYLEDRRPGANCDPYLVTALLVDTISGSPAIELESTGERLLSRAS
jgi:glutamine synthetase